MPRALFLSPHLDDVAFSCGGTAFALAKCGWETTLCTVFTRSVPSPRGFALACQTDKGIAPEVDYLALRRAEDDVAAQILGFSQIVRLDLPEAPHRGYETAPALFGAYVATDDIAPELEARLHDVCADVDAIFAPQALGAHVDHRRVRDAVTALRASGTLAARTLWYRDAPYVLREPEAHPTEPLASAAPHLVPVAPDALAAKLDACAAYTTQLGFQFGGDTVMREALTAFACDEGRRHGQTVPAEIFLDDAGASLQDVPAVIARPRTPSL